MEKNHPYHQSWTSRKNFLKYSAAAVWSLLFAGGALKQLMGQEKNLRPRKKRAVSCACSLAVIRGDDIRASLRKALDELGGLGLFVKKNDTVVIKPNIGWNRGPEFAANTNPDLVNELVTLCYRSGAKKVRVFDNTCNNEKMCYHNSGIYRAVKDAGGDIYYVSDWKFIPANFPYESPMQDWPIYKDAVECDCFINVPVAKHHSLTGLTLSMKNLMGVCGGSRGQMHWGIDKKLADLTAFINPDLTIIDAYKILLRHGPSGGNTNDVETRKTIIAGPDPVLADAYATTLFNMRPSDVGYIVRGAEKKIGSMDISSASIKKVTI
ncbi:MAG TPA: DUF362 domain-containing protein [Spirochaetota bacterium]|nr:DUF362 domain-containing protein [Spirochaetota bacterium]HPI88605.1 DUF362 domain-containing protein [Spirochaetota bacterium]HPR48246.1 DUF362 domain-containing protein [Spirochaetota bacterium]